MFRCIAFWKPQTIHPPFFIYVYFPGPFPRQPEFLASFAFRHLHVEIHSAADPDGPSLPWSFGEGVIG